jgi:hypothetical protein
MQHDKYEVTQHRYGKWFHNNERWLINIREQKTGDIVPVRRRSGQVSYQELGIQVAPGLYTIMRKVSDTEIYTGQLIGWHSSPDSTT